MFEKVTGFPLDSLVGLQPCGRAERSEVAEASPASGWPLVEKLVDDLMGALSVKGKVTGRGCNFPSCVSHTSNGT